MHVVIFQVEFHPGRRADYLELAGQLKRDLERIDGFLSVERFASLGDPDKLLSVSYWRDEQAIGRWREFAAHRAAQAEGKRSIFSDYRITVAEVLRDYGPRD